MKTRLGLLRHGQTDWNIDLRLQGTADIPMNQTGIDQIRKAALVLKDHGWQRIVSSPLTRAVQTAEIVAEVLGIPNVEVEDILLERAFGVGEGMTYTQWQAQFAGLDEIPGAESMQQVQSRAQKLLDMAASHYEQEAVLAVSHGAFIRAVISNVSQGLYPPKGERLQNASLHVFEHQNDWQLHSWAPDPLA